ncbi:hypothetical protein CsSME_00042266 [Camellia sinensis var. sinensis]
MFYDESNVSQMYELRCKSTRIKQDGRELALYFAEMKRIWQELDQRRPIAMKCAADIKLRQDEIRKDRLYDFLAGLDDVYDQARSDLLRLRLIPILNESFNYLHREVQRRETMLKKTSDTISASAALLVKPMPGRLPSSWSAYENKDDLQYTHCNGERHTEDTCFHKYGYPDWFLERRKQLKATRRPSLPKPAGSSAGLAAIASSCESTPSAAG